LRELGTSSLISGQQAQSFQHGLTAPWLSRSTQQGYTPLHEAAMEGHANVCALLLDRGASPVVRTRMVQYMASAQALRPL